MDKGIRAIASTIVIYAIALPAAAGLITVGTPDKDGTDVITITLKDGTVKVVTVDVTKGMTVDAKSDAVQFAINNAQIDASRRPTFEVDVADSKNITFKTESGEKDRYTAAILPGSGRGSTLIGYALLARFGALVGVNSDGNAATYTAGFEFIGPSFGDILLSANIAFADLLVPTVDGLLQQEFGLLRNQLLLQAPSLVGFLTLDLVGDAITFAPAGYFASVSAFNGTTDVALSSNFAVAVVPEPATGLLMLAALLCASCAHPKRRPDPSRGTAR